MRKRDYYDVLGIPRLATSQAIRQAYRRLARQCSPDINVWDDRAGETFAEITEAYRVLTDPAARGLYDRLGHRAFEVASEPPAAAELHGDDLHSPVELEFEDALRGVLAVVDVMRQTPCPLCRGTGGVEGRGATRCTDCGGRGVRTAAAAGRPAARCATCGGAGWRAADPCPGCGGRGTVP